ncbi:SIP domain-containing protein [Microbacterium sp. JZ31]|uniref:SIP domain-containing protein n=1 Tax=Microbacterium sp. JZ31 TaxID=1906274 RepID=UPI0019322854|nr:SIP domain-containing protein [Microbacterium sp. JZ31]
MSSGSPNLRSDGSRRDLLAVEAHPPAEPHALTAYLAGEQALVAAARRHLVSVGVPKQRISFTGYWRIGRAG